MPYIISFILAIIFAKFSEHYRYKDRVLFYIFLIVSIMIPTLLAGLRNIEVGTDVMSYIVPDYNIAYYFTDIRSFVEYILVYRNREIGYSIIIFIASRMGSPNWALFFLQLITMACVYLGIQRRRNTISPVFALILYFFFFYLNSYNIMRQMAAAAIIFYGSLYIEEKRYYRFLPYIVIAMLFHWSAAYSIIFILIHMAVKRGWLFQGLFALGVSLGFIAINYFTQYVVNWIRWFHYINVFSRNTNSDQTAEMITYLLIMFILILIAGVMKKISENYPYNLMISYILVVMAISCTIIPSIKRITYYFALINLPIVCQIPYAFGNVNTKNTISIGILIYAFVFWIFMFVIAGSGGVMPYISIFE